MTKIDFQKTFHKRDYKFYLVKLSYFKLKKNILEPFWRIFQVLIGISVWVVKVVNIHKRPIWAQRPTFFQFFSSDSDSSSHFTLSMNWIWKNMPRNKKFWINRPNFEIPPTLLLSSLEQNFYFSILLFYSYRAWKMLNKMFLKYEFWLKNKKIGPFLVLGVLIKCSKIALFQVHFFFFIQTGGS